MEKEKVELGVGVGASLVGHGTNNFQHSRTLFSQEISVPRVLSVFHFCVKVSP